MNATPATAGFDLQDHVAIVTGGNSGLGLAMALALSQAGAAVCIWGTDARKNSRARAALGDDGGRVLALECDVSDEEAVERAFAATLERFGQVNSCFANAGVNAVAPSFAGMSTAQWREVLAVNLDGAFFTFRAAARHMVDAARGGSLVATSSIAALFGRPYRTHYSVAKAGLLALVRSLAVELGPHGIRVNAIVPGSMTTFGSAHPLGLEEVPAHVRRLASRRVDIGRIPLRRRGQPADVGGLAVFLAGPASAYLTGCMIPVDGGYAIA